MYPGAIGELVVAPLNAWSTAGVVGDRGLVQKYQVAVRIDTAAVEIIEIGRAPDSRTVAQEFGMRRTGRQAADRGPVRCW